MRLRQHVADDRSAVALSAAILRLLHIRATFLQKHGLAENTTPDDTLGKKIWNEDLQDNFKEEMYEHDDSHLSSKRRRAELHGRFKAWVHLAFGDKETTQSILDNGLAPDVVNYLKSI